MHDDEHSDASFARTLHAALAHPTRAARNQELLAVLRWRWRHSGCGSAWRVLRDRVIAVTLFEHIGAHRKDFPFQLCENYLRGLM